MNRLAKAAIAFTSAVSATLSFAQNLLVDDCFENSTNPLPHISSIASGGNPVTVGLWGVEAADIAYGLQGDGVSPFQGNAMLRAWDDGLTYSQIWQFVDVTGYAPWIDAGLAVASVSAFFNAYLPAGPAEVGVRLHCSSDPVGIWGTFVPVVYSGLFTLDNSPQTWEQVAASGFVPAGTRFVLFELMFKDDPLRFPGGGLFGYADCASLDLRVVPEPATLAALLPGLLVFARRRNRK